MTTIIGEVSVGALYLAPLLLHLAWQRKLSTRRRKNGTCLKFRLHLIVRQDFFLRVVKREAKSTVKCRIRTARNLIRRHGVGGKGKVKPTPVQGETLLNSNFLGRLKFNHVKVTTVSCPTKTNIRRRYTTPLQTADNLLRILFLDA